MPTCKKGLIIRYKMRKKSNRKSELFLIQKYPIFDKRKSVLEVFLSDYF